MELNFGRVEGLPPEEQEWLKELKYIYDYHRSTNRKKRRYYNGKITLNEVNLGIALPSGLGRLEILRGAVRFVHRKPCNHAGFTRFEN